MEDEKAQLLLHIIHEVQSTAVDDFSFPNRSKSIHASVCM